MRARRIAVLAVAGALVAGGAGAAIGATQNNEAKETEAKILADAAQRLDTTPDKLRDALGAAEDAQLDRAVKAGRLTPEQADELKRRRQESGRVLGLPFGRGHHGPGRPGFGHGPGRGVIDAVADALGITEQQLFDRLRNGRTIAQIAKAQSRTLGDVKAAARAAVKKELDAAVKADRITQAQADAMLSHVDEMVDRLGDKRFFGRGRHHDRPPGDQTP